MDVHATFSADDAATAFATEGPYPASTTDGFDLDDLFCDRSSVREFRRSYEPALFWTIAAAGGVGNLLVVCVYLNVWRHLKTTEVYLLNLAAADLLFLATLPLWAAEASRGWTFGAASCKAAHAVYKVNLFSSMLLLACVSADRYVAIVETAWARNLQAQLRRCSRLCCAAVWLFAASLASPELAFAAVEEDEDEDGGRSSPLCVMRYPPRLGPDIKTALLSLQVTWGFLLPLAVMAVCYGVILSKLLRTRGGQKHRAMRLVLAVVAAFVATQLPYNGALLAEAVQARNMSMTDCEAVKRFNVAERALRALSFSHACLNPILYAFVAQRFRRQLGLQAAAVLRRRSPPRHSSSSKTARSSAQSDTSQTLSL